MWAPRVMDLDRIRQVPGLEQLENRACTTVSQHVHPSLTHLSQVMEPAIEQVSERVYSAVGFDVANATFVVGHDGLVVIDAMLSIENMAAALRAFREISEYPVKGVVYTHSHGDHWGGSPALVTPEQASSAEVPVIAQRQLMAEIARINGFNAPVMAARSAYQFGLYLDCSPEGRVNVGAGPFLDQRQTVGLVPPNTLVDDRLEIELAGIRMEIVWVPSEAPDEIAVWLPGLGVLQSAECVQGECYPNLYTLRGDVPRPAAQWVRSLDVLRTFPAEALAKSHGRSVVGAGASRDHLRNYRDVIAWTHDQTVRRMNQGYVPDQIVERLAMPPHLRGYETTGIEGYGSVPQGSRMIYAWYLGFSQGEVTDFDPAPYHARQQGYVAAMGGPDRVLELAQQAIDRGDNRWAIEILGYLVRSQPGHSAARKLDAEAHRREGLTKHNATWRNWYLTAAAELEGQVPAAVATSFADILAAQPVAAIIAALPVRLRAELTWYVEQRLVLDIAGHEPGTFTLHLRRGVLEVLDGAASDADATIRFADKAALVAYLTGTAVDQLVASSRAELDGDREAVAQFGSYLDPPPDASRIMVTLHGPAQ
ncbi:MAG TPA: alkyl sulfatase dimerization domain-containing protein [Streptosporangiaceae bacterium]|nr:alkyl sulfatase dimerization domain-containing protein [Streptosporangiaceae bacterium]